MTTYAAHHVQDALLIFLGGLLAAAGRAAYGLWVITHQGGADLLARIGIETLAIDVLGLHLWAAMGAALGAVAAGLLVWRKRRLEAALLRAHGAPSSAQSDADPHARLLRIQREKAQAYLDSRPDGNSQHSS